MSNVWMVTALTSTAIALIRELLGLGRYLRRRASIEQIATRIALPGSHLVDQDEHGARFELTIEHHRLQPPSADTE